MVLMILYFTTSLVQQIKFLKLTGVCSMISCHLVVQSARKAITTPGETSLPLL
jgi:hypothetical protein